MISDDWEEIINIIKNSKLKNTNSMGYQNIYHPETKDTETFFENVYEFDTHKINKYINSPNFRIGNYSYDKNKFPIPEMKPVFKLKSPTKKFYNTPSFNEFENIPLSKPKSEYIKNIRNLEINNSMVNPYSHYQKEDTQKLYEDMIHSSISLGIKTLYYKTTPKKEKQ